MRILLVNDDGIESPGLALLARAALRLGEVWAVAPVGQCSAMSHRITLHGFLDVHRAPDFPVPGVRAFSVDGTPADCVKAALAHVLDAPPDVVFSGVNRGCNLGRDILYSGTVGAAMEALVSGVPAVAWSAQTDGGMDVAERWLGRVADEIFSRSFAADCVWNVNFPACAPEDVRGVRWDCAVSKNPFYRGVYTPQPLADGARLVLGGEVARDAEPGSDIRALLDGYIAVNRLRCMAL